MKPFFKKGLLGEVGWGKRLRRGTAAAGVGKKSKLCGGISKAINSVDLLIYADNNNQKAKKYRNFFKKDLLVFAAIWYTYI